MFQSDFFTPDSVPPRERLPAAIGRHIAACLADGRHLVRSNIAGFFAEESGYEAPGRHWSIAILSTVPD